jgi:hypothetical protein
MKAVHDACAQGSFTLQRWLAAARSSWSGAGRLRIAAEASGHPRHAMSRFALDVCTQAKTRAKRQAQGKVAEMILPEERRLKRLGPELDPNLTVTWIAIH